LLKTIWNGPEGPTIISFALSKNGKRYNGIKEESYILNSQELWNPEQYCLHIDNTNTLHT
jgi:hypothetical protein